MLVIPQLLDVVTLAIIDRIELKLPSSLNSSSLLRHTSQFFLLRQGSSFDITEHTKTFRMPCPVYKVVMCAAVSWMQDDGSCNIWIISHVSQTLAVRCDNRIFPFYALEAAPSLSIVCDSEQIVKTCDGAWFIVIDKALDVLRHEVNQNLGAIPIEEGFELAHPISSPPGRIY